MIALVFTSLLGTAMASSACDAGFEGIAPSNVNAFVDSEVSFRVEGDASCTNTLACVWETEDDATLSSTNGRSTGWIAPDTLYRCITDYYGLYVSCIDDQSDVYYDFIEIELDCTEAQLEAAKSDYSLGGGSCGQGVATTAWLLPLLLPFGWLRRRLDADTRETRDTP